MEVVPGYECIPCVARLTLEALDTTEASEEVCKKMMRRLLQEAEQLLDDKTAPLVVGNLTEYFCELTGEADPYKQFKRTSVSLSLQILPGLRRLVAESPDPVLRAFELSAAANAIDLVSLRKNELQQQMEKIAEAGKIEIKSEVMIQFRRELEEAGEIFLIGDNTAEAVFDLLLLEQLNDKELYYGVRGAPVLNDVTKVEALETGIYRWADIISSDSSVPGTILSQVSDEFLQHFKEADLVLAKGQGNFESLVEPPRPVYHLFKVKCKPLATRLEYDLDDYVLISRS